MARARRHAETAGTDGIKLNVLCARLGVSYRDARYALARGITPKGVENDPGRGNHRLFNWAQAFELAVVLKLKAAGFHTPLAGMISKFAARIEGLSVGLAWDSEFAPLHGKFTTEHRWYFDIGDGRYVRHVTDASPRKGGSLEEIEWVDARNSRLARSAAPVVIVRIDLAQIARLLADEPTRPGRPSSCLRLTSRMVERPMHQSRCRRVADRLLFEWNA